MTDSTLHLLDLTEPRWREFVERQPAANIFHHPAWIGMLARCYNFRPFALALCASNGAIRAGVPVAESNRLLSGRRWISLPFSDHCSPLAEESTLAGELMQSMRAFAKSHGAPRIEVRWPDESESARPSPASFVLHTMRLDSDIAKTTGQIHHSHLRNVRAAQSHGLQIKHASDSAAMQEFYNIHLKTRHKQGVPVQPMCYFKLLDELILQKGLGFILLAYHEKKCLAGAVFLHWKQTLTYKYGASIEAGLKRHPNHLIFWDAIKWGCENGFSRLDFGRSDMENIGLRTFKERWGARETPLRYFVVPSQGRSSRAGRFLKAAVQALIRKTPVGVCKLGGQLYYKHLA